MTVVFLPTAAHALKQVVVVQARTEFREAFAYMRQHQQPDDLRYIMYPDVYRVYYGKDDPFFDFPRLQAMTAAELAGRRAWLVAALPDRNSHLVLPPEIATALERRHGVCLADESFEGVHVLLYAFPGESATVSYNESIADK
jgi:hypothetical protein